VNFTIRTIRSFTFKCCAYYVNCIVYISVEGDWRKFSAAERGDEEQISIDRRRKAGDEQQWGVLEHRRRSLWLGLNVTLWLRLVTCHLRQRSLL